MKPTHVRVMRIFAKRVKSRRLELGMDQQTLARKAGLAPNVISQYERASLNGSVGVIAKIAAALEIKFTDLFEGL